MGMDKIPNFDLSKDNFDNKSINNEKKTDNSLGKAINEKNIERIRNKSLESHEQYDIEKTEEKKYSKKKVIGIIVTTVVLSVAVTMGVTKATEIIKDNHALNEALSDYKRNISTIVQHNPIYKSLDNGAKGPIVGYDASGIANTIKGVYTTDEEKEKAIYALYENYGTEKNGIFNNITGNVVDKLYPEEKYEDFDDFINKKYNCKTRKDYVNKLQQFVIDEYNYEKSKEGVGGKQWK